MNPNWKTTVSGIITIIVGIGNLLLQLLGSGFTAEGVAISALALTGGTGLIAAKDTKPTPPPLSN